MPPRKQRVSQAEDESLPVTHGTESAPDAVGAQEGQEGSAHALTDAPDPVDLLEEQLRKKIRRQTFMVHPEGSRAFNRRKTYVVSFKPVLEEESAGEDDATETAAVFVRHSSDIQESPPASTSVADQETKSRGRKKKEMTTANPEGNELPSAAPQKRGRKKKMLSVDQTASNIPVGSSNNDEPALVDNIKDDHFAEEKNNGNSEKSELPSEVPPKRARKKKMVSLEQAATNIPVGLAHNDETPLVDNMKDDDFAEEKNASKPKAKNVEASLPKKAEKRGRKKKMESTEQPTADITEAGSSNVASRFVDGGDSAQILLHQADNGKASQVNPKKPIKRRKK